MEWNKLTELVQFLQKTKLFGDTYIYVNPKQSKVRAIKTSLSTNKEEALALAKLLSQKYNVPFEYKKSEYKVEDKDKLEYKHSYVLEIHGDTVSVETDYT